MRMRNVKNKKEIIEGSNYCLKDYKNYQGNFQKLFPRKQPLYVELGMGKGKFLIENAKTHPNINFIGIEKQDSIVAKALKKLEEEKLDNLYIICANALEIDTIFHKEVMRLYLNFSDPWPKVRHHSRRLTSKIFLEKYDAIFQENPSIYLRTDNEELFSYSLVSLSNYGYILKEVTLDLHKKENLITTEYEDKFANCGIKIKALIAEKTTSNKDKSS